ncbi:hypothetical protein B0H16DRAFT_1371253 [Mycena metata]|uniref:Uncharacterized protein n=1 Tax=Mycena metata TaxID=1033252 RepID=A0AAD7HS09_9AGAR|nr:hypothetical protein B0H16DRAFT_1697866 [Mycena metata]KAJ7757148.1 hypothetical protein B0H16DRAFT_1371253 [Mycena metata]
MQHTSFLAKEEPLDALCHHFSLAKALYPANTPLQPTFDMQIIGPISRLPTHVLAVLPADNNPNIPPLMVPVDAALYHQSFGNVGLLPQVVPGTAPPAQHLGPGAQLPTVTLPVVPVNAPHTLSVALLLLFGLGFETDRNLLAVRVLPSVAIEEFPNAMEMARVMSRLADPQWDWYLRYNQGLWKNILAFAPHDTALVELVRTTYKVVADARRMRGQRW